MRANRRRDTGPERAIRSALHGAGLRFRVDYAIRVPGAARAIRPDIVFTRRRVAVFIDGCFWHGCAAHSSVPRTNSDYWAPKLTRNAERDREQAAVLTSAGWEVIRVWEHEDAAAAAGRISAMLRETRQ